MMDLTKSLPSKVIVGDRDFSVKVDFRKWIEFGQVLKERNYNPTLNDLFVVLDENMHPYKDELPELLKELINFYKNKNVLPRSEPSGVISSDWNYDAEFIYASFLQQYGIDLFDTKELHWHKFLALFRSLSDDTIQGKIMSYRSYKKEKRDNDAILCSLKYAWDIPVEYTEEEKQKIEEFDSYFG